MAAMPSAGLFRSSRVHLSLPAFRLEMSYGNQNTPDFSLWAGGTKGRWESSIGTDLFHTDGYILVPEANRGSVDQKAGSEDVSTDLMIGRKFGESDEVFARGWLLEESRQNGTPLTTNDTHLGEGAVGANLKLGNAGTLTLRSYGDFQTYHQSFSSVALNRNSESLTDLQTVPAQGIGASAVWSRTLGKRQTLVAGSDTHEEIGHSDERTFSAGNPLNLTFAGGRHERSAFLARTLYKSRRHGCSAQARDSTIGTISMPLSLPFR